MTASYTHVMSAAASLCPLTTRMTRIPIFACVLRVCLSQVYMLVHETLKIQGYTIYLELGVQAVKDMCASVRS